MSVKTGKLLIKVVCKTDFLPSAFYLLNFRKDLNAIVYRYQDCLPKS